MGKSFLTASIVDALGAMGKRVALTASTGVASVQARTYINNVALNLNLKHEREARRTDRQHRRRRRPGARPLNLKADAKSRG